MENVLNGGGWRSSRLLLGALLAAIALPGLALLQAISDMPSGYGNAQFGSAPSLAAEDTHPPLAELADGATADLVRFIPGYTVLAALLFLVAFLVRGRRVDDVATMIRGSRLLAVGVVADIIETVLFRSTVNELIDGVDPADLATQVLFTRIAFVVKYAGLLAALWMLVKLVRSPRAAMS